MSTLLLGVTTSSYLSGVGERRTVGPMRWKMSSTWIGRVFDRMLAHQAAERGVDVHAASTTAACHGPIDRPYRFTLTTQDGECLCVEAVFLVDATGLHRDQWDWIWCSPSFDLLRRAAPVFSQSIPPSKTKYGLIAFRGRRARRRLTTESKAILGNIRAAKQNLAQ